MECEIVVFKINPQAMSLLKAESISGLTQYDGNAVFESESAAAALSLLSKLSTESGCRLSAKITLYSLGVQALVQVDGKTWGLKGVVDELDGDVLPEPAIINEVMELLTRGVIAPHLCN
jgi:hypothetical protein